MNSLIGVVPPGFDLMMPHTPSPLVSMATNAVPAYSLSTRTAPSLARTHAAFQPSAHATHALWQLIEWHCWDFTLLPLAGETVVRVHRAHVPVPNGDGPEPSRHQRWGPHAVTDAVHLSAVRDDVVEEVLPSAIREKSTPLGSVRLGHSQQAGS
jgi:hypothetical protein